MNDYTLRTISSDLVPSNYLSLARNACTNRDKSIKVLLEKKKIPREGWDSTTIEHFINELALMDSNNFPYRCGIGEREARVVCDLVRRRHYNLAHGVGRSGSLTDAQPKAAGSTIMANLTNCLLLDLIRKQGVGSCKRAILFPMATGMALMFTLLTLKSKRPGARFVLWSRIDQLSCFKSILTAGLIPVIIDTVEGEENGDRILRTNLESFETKITEIGAENICCVLSTTSCFAPRTCDSMLELGKLCHEHCIPHVANNAYGLQSSYLTHQLDAAGRMNGLDIFVQSTDKNLMVPVGGSIIAGFDETLVDRIALAYPGRASGSQTLDVLMTILSLGQLGYDSLVAERKSLHRYLVSELTRIADGHGECVSGGKNPISVAFSLRTFGSKPQLIGSMLQRRGVSGCRVIVPDGEASIKDIEGYQFTSWGAHSDQAKEAYLTASAALGVTKQEIDTFVEKLDLVLKEFRCKSNESVTSTV